jgi:hypothetical protein
MQLGFITRNETAALLTSLGLRTNSQGLADMASEGVGPTYAIIRAFCGKCKHSARLSLMKLRARLGDDFPLKDVRPRLRCRRCRSRHIVITFLGPHQRGGSLAHMFTEPLS